MNDGHGGGLECVVRSVCMCVREVLMLFLNLLLQIRLVVAICRVI